MGNRISDLEADVDRLRLELQAAEMSLNEERARAGGVAIGDIVQGTGRYAGKTIRVDFVRAFGGSKPWVKGVMKRADGSWGTRERNIFDHWVKP